MARPIMVPLAPSAQAIKHGAADIGTPGAQCTGFDHVLAAADAAVHVHLDVLTHGVHDAGQGLDARLRAIELAAAVVADDQGVCTRLHRQAGVFHILNAFEDQLAAPALFDPLHIAPVQGGVKLRGGPGRQAAHVGHARDVAHDVAELATRCAQHAQSPAGLGGDVDHVFDGQLGRRGQAVFQVLVALAEDLQIEREHQGAAVGRLGAVDQALDEALVFHHVQLKPEALPRMLGHVFDGADAHGR